MKYLLALALTFIVYSTQAQDETSNINWLTNLEQAQKMAKKEKKPIMLYFTGSDWCAPCKMLKEDFFETEKFGQLADQMVMVYIDRPRRVDILTPEQLEYNKTVIAEYNAENTYPKLLALSARGKVMGKISGYSSLRDPSNHFSFVEKYLR